VEFTCALLNAQPMGFYSPATLVGDAQRHGVEVRPIDVLHSAWDCTLEPLVSEANGSVGPAALGYAVRMGLRWTKGLSRPDAERLLEARRARPFGSLEDFVRRTRLPTRVHDTLAEAGALAGLCEPRPVLPDGSAGLARFHAPSRRDALWQLRGFIARQDDAMALGDPDDAVAFPPLSRLQEIVWDHASSEHSTRGHPLAPLRGELRANRWPDARTVARGRDGQRIEYVGVVICRQQPGTAGGVVFMTREDETGFVNVVVWDNVFERFAFAIKSEPFLGISGRVQNEDGVVHLVARRVWVPRLDVAPAGVASRDFH
jgi:error-prone DNA polymerase